MEQVRRAWGRWVAYWAQTESPSSLALVRLCLGAVLLWEFVEIWRLDLVVPLFGLQEVGGLSDSLTRGAGVPFVYQVLPPTAGSAILFHALVTLAALLFTLGVVPRLAAAALLLLWAQHADVLPAADRGIDTLCRDVLCIFVFARSGATLSLPAWWRTGSLFGITSDIGAWARRLVILQLVAMYFLAGIQKTGVHWWPAGNFAALYFILQDPAIARFDFAWLRHQPWFFLTQLGTVGTVVFQSSYPLVFLWIHYRKTPDRPGRLRAWSNRYHFDAVWIATGALFHLLLAATMELGIFPWAMLALYPAWIHPRALDRLRERIGARRTEGSQRLVR